MAITNLTGTTWLMMETIPFASSNFYKYFTNINFVSYAKPDTTYSRFYISVRSESYGYTSIQYGYTDVYTDYNNRGWKNPLNRIITFIGGADATKAALINIITTYATPLPNYYRAKDEDFIAVADAIRTKGGTSAPLEFPSGFVTAINDITTPIPSNYGRIEYDGSILTVS